MTNELEGQKRAELRENFLNLLAIANPAVSLPASQPAGAGNKPEVHDNDCQRITPLC